MGSTAFCDTRLHVGQHRQAAPTCLAHTGLKAKGTASFPVQPGLSVVFMACTTTCGYNLAIHCCNCIFQFNVYRLPVCVGAVAHVVS